MEVADLWSLLDGACAADGPLCSDGSMVKLPSDDVVIQVDSGSDDDKPSAEPKELALVQVEPDEPKQPREKFKQRGHRLCEHMRLVKALRNSDKNIRMSQRPYQVWLTLGMQLTVCGPASDAIGQLLGWSHLPSCGMQRLGNPRWYLRRHSSL